MREPGYVEGQNIFVEGRFYGDHTDRLPALAAELVRLNVDVIVAGTTPAPEAAQRATSTIPIGMAIHADPVRSGLVGSLAKPEKNVTGVSGHGPDLVGKRLRLLKEAIPGISRVAVLSNPDRYSHLTQIEGPEGPESGEQLPPPSGRSLRGAAFNRYRARLSGMFKRAMKRGLVERNPVAGTEKEAEPGGRVVYLPPATTTATLSPPASSWLG
jgi:hypothetical protein